MLKTHEHHLFIRKVEVISLSFFKISYEIILIGFRSKLASLWIFHISWTNPSPKRREYRSPSSPYLIWSDYDWLTWNLVEYIASSLKSITSKRDWQTCKPHHGLNYVWQNSIPPPRRCPFERISFSSRYVKNLLKRYSPPQSDQRVLIFFSIYFSTSLRNHLNISNDSDLYFIDVPTPR